MSDFQNQLNTDFANMLNTTEFAKFVSYDAQDTGQNYSINVIYEATFAHIDNRTQANTTSPMIFFKRDDLPAKILRGDVVTVDAIVFTVSSQQPDGIGGVMVFLTKDDE